jgi:hypothetical protein
MAGAGQVGRGWDLDRIIKNYEQRINTLEKLARGAGTSMFLVDAPRWRSKLVGVTAAANGATVWLEYSVAQAAPQHDPAGNSNSFFVYSNSAGQHRYTAQVAGLYWVAASIQWQAGAGGTRKHNITINNAGDAVPLHTYEGPPNAAADLRVTVQGPVALAAGDWFRVNVWQNSGGSLNINNSDDSTSASGGRAGSYLTIVPIGAYDVA